MVSVIQPLSRPEPGPLTRERRWTRFRWRQRSCSTHGQTTERTIVAAERLGRALGVPVTALPYWGQLTVEIDGTTLSQIVPVKPLGVDMGKVLAVTTVVDQVCDGKLEAGAARSLRSRWQAASAGFDAAIHAVGGRWRGVGSASFSARSMQRACC